MPNERIFREPLRGPEIQVHVRTKAALIENESNFLAELLRGLQEKIEIGRQSVIARSERSRLSVWRLPMTPLSCCNNAGSATGNTSPDGVSTSRAKSSGSAATGLRSGEISSASATLAGFAAFPGLRKCGRYRSNSWASRPVRYGNPIGVAELLRAKRRSPHTPPKPA